MSGQEQATPTAAGTKGVAAFAAVGLAGAGLSIYLTWVHLVVKHAGETVEGLCNLSSKINCNVAAGSGFSQVGGVPIAVLGLGFYVGTLVLLGFARKGGDRIVPRLLLALYTVACLYSVFLAGVSALVLGSFCWACTGLYVVNTVGLVLSRVMCAQGYMASYKALVGDLKAVGGSSASFAFLAAMVATVVGGTFAVGALGEQMASSPGDHAAEAAAWVKEEYLTTERLDARVRQAIEASGSDKGPADAPVVVVEFSDFECPFCSKVAPLMEDLVKEFPGKVRVVFRHNPLDMACNPRVTKPFHQHACDGARAAICAAEQGKFWEMHDQLFAHQRQLSPEALPDHAKVVGLDLNEFGACLGSSRPQDVIKADVLLGKQAGARGTPTLIINGRLVRGAVPWWKLKAAVEAELDAVGQR